MKRTILNLFALTLIVGGATHLNAQFSNQEAACCSGGGASCCGSGGCSADAGGVSCW